MLELRQCRLLCLSHLRRVIIYTHEYKSAFGKSGRLFQFGIA